MVGGWRRPARMHCAASGAWAPGSVLLAFRDTPMSCGGLPLTRRAPAWCRPPWTTLRCFGTFPTGNSRWRQRQQRIAAAGTRPVVASRLQPFGVLRGHSDTLMDCSFSDCGTLVATAGFDHTARVWSAETQSCLRTFVGHRDGLILALFSPDCQTLYSTSFDKTFRVWDVETGNCRDQLDHGADIWELTQSNHRKWLATCTEDGLCRRLDTHGRCLQTVSHTAAITTCMYTANNSHLVTSSEDTTLRVWHVQPRRLDELCMAQLVRSNLVKSVSASLPPTSSLAQRISAFDPANMALLGDGEEVVLQPQDDDSTAPDSLEFNSEDENIIVAGLHGSSDDEGDDSLVSL
eukprot:m.190990 g.190990  ORF g.190990 m.190990 type:complete len:348 (-) comp18243_c0_seq2:82-1125(-)